MLEFNTVSFLLLVVLGAFVQTISGFALGLVIIVGATILKLELIAFSAAVISLISLVNSSVALRTSYRNIDRHYLTYLCIALLPGLLIGVALLTYLSEVHYFMLRVLLGFVVIVVGILLLLKPALYRNRSGGALTLAFGVLGGVIGGLFSSGGSAWAYHLYRQPINVDVIRATLLAVLIVSCVVRTIMITVAGQMTTSILITALISVPVVIVVTEVTSRNLTRIPDNIVRRLVVGLMTLTGFFLIFG